MAYITDSVADREISRLAEQNERLKDDLFILLQPQGQASDASIRSDYNHLCRSIEFWVDNVIEDSSLDIPDKRRRKGERRERHLLKELGITSFTPKDEKRSAYFLLSVAVQRELQTRVFDRPYPVGFTKQQENVINQVLEGMRKAEFGRGEQAKQFARDRPLTDIKND